MLEALKNKPRLSGEADASIDLSPEDLYDRVAPSVVTIIVKDENEELIGTGSGFFIDEALIRDRRMSYRYVWLDSDEEAAKLHSKEGRPAQHGYVLTNYHVIARAASADVVLFNGDKGTVCHVIGDDEITDLALLSVSVTSERPLQPIPLATSNPRILSTVYAIGSPKGLDGTASQGKVSAYRTVDGKDFWLQTDAAISLGSSGGPLVSPDGLVVGVTTTVHESGQNLNFAVPASIVRSFFSAANFSSRRREVAEGGSIKWHEDRAFHEVLAALESPVYTAGQREALELLDEARKELLLGELIENSKNEQVLHYQRAFSLAEEAIPYIPAELKYAAHYIAGKVGLTAEVELNAKPGAVGTRSSFYSPLHKLRFVKGGGTTAAIAHLVEATKLRTNFASSYEYLALYYADTGNWSDALSSSLALVHLVPRNIPAIQLLAECYTELNQPERAIELLEAEAWEVPRSGSLLYQLAQTHAGLGNYRDAIVYYRAALKCSLQGLHGAVHYDLGVALQQLERHEEAMAEFNKAKSYGWSAESCDSRIAECTQLDSVTVTNRYQQQTRPDQREVTVYVTKTGTKYHLDGCQYLRKSRIPMPLSEAISAYEPCSRCGPPRN